MIPEPSQREHTTLSFEIHRVAEGLVGLALVSFALHVTGSLSTLLAGVAVMVPALITRGRLGIVSWCSTAVHRWLDLLLVGILAALPLVPDSGGASLAAVAEPSAAVLLLLSARTDYTARRRATARVAPPVAPVVEVTARRLGTLAGRVERAARAAVEKDERRQ